MYIFMYIRLVLQSSLTKEGLVIPGDICVVATRWKRQSFTDFHTSNITYSCAFMFSSRNQYMIYALMGCKVLWYYWDGVNTCFYCVQNAYNFLFVWSNSFLRPRLLFCLNGIGRRRMRMEGIFPKSQKLSLPWCSEVWHNVA